MGEKASFGVGEVEVAERGVDRRLLVGFGLRFTFDFHFSEDVSLRWVRVELWAMAGASERRVGTLEPCEPVVPARIMAPERERRWAFFLRLSSAEVAALDASRGGEDAALKFHIRCGWTDTAQDASSEVWLRHRIAASDWLTLMRDAGACEVLNCDIRLPPRERAPRELQEAVGLLRRARDELSAGRRAREVVILVRRNRSGGVLSVDGRAATPAA
jgi:hypothetical protein